jgi:hypothetical protein
MYEVARFYNSSILEVFNMPLSVFNKAAMSMKMLKAEEAMVLYQSSMYPNAKEGHRDKMWTQLVKQKDQFREQKVLTMDELKTRLENV